MPDEDFLLILHLVNGTIAMKDIIEPLRLILMNASLRHILPPFAVLAAVIISAVSCGRSQHERSIAVADSLVEADQRAAVTYIDSIASPSRGGLPRSVRMKLALLRAKAANKLMLPLNRDSLLMLSDYFADHGTPNERMLATYILGCSYLDDNDAPRAVEQFRQAVSLADTLDGENCDYNTLSRVYAVMGDVQQRQMLPDDALLSGRRAIRFALASGDSLYAVSVYRNMANIYHQIGQNDSVMRICHETAEWYKRHGYYEDAAATYFVPVFVMMEHGRPDEAKPYMDFLEKHSSAFDGSAKSVKKGNELYYYIKGLYYLYENKLDSAEYLFRKELRSTSDYNNRQAASRGLYLLYKRMGVADSITKYAEIWNVAIDSAYADMSTLNLQQMKAMYDYSNSERMAERKAAEAVKYKYTAAILVIAFALAVFIILFIQQKRKKELERAKQINATNAMYMALLGKKEKELEAALNDKIKNEKLINEKKEEIRQLEEKLSALRDGDFNTLRRDKSLIFDAPIIERLHELAGSSSKASVADVGCLRKHADDFMPDFMRSLNIAVNGLGSVEVEVCILIRLQFMTSEISCLLGISPQRLTNIRKRLNMKIFGKDGGAKEFDQRLRQYFPAS